VAGYEGLVANIPLGRAGMRALDNRLLYEPGELADAQDVTFADNHLRKAAGIERMDPDGGAGTPVSYTATRAGNALTVRGVVGTWPCSAAPTYTIRAVAHQYTFATLADCVRTLPFTYLNNVAAGQTIIFALKFRRRQVDDLLADNTWTAVDDVGSTFTFDSRQEYIDGSADTVCIRFFRCLVTTPITAGDDLTVTVPARIGVVDRVELIADAFANVTDAADLGKSYDTADTVAVSTVVGTPQSVPQLGYAASVTETAMASGAGWTDLTALSAYTPYVEFQPAWASLTTRATAGALFHFRPNSIGITGPGTVSTTANSITVTGVATLFNFSGIQASDYIRIGTERRRIASIVSATVLTVDRAFAVTNAPGTAYTVERGGRVIMAVTSGQMYRSTHTGFATTSFLDLTANTPVTGLSSMPTPGKFVLGGRESGSPNAKLFYFNGMDTVRVMTEAGVVTALASPPTDWSTVGRRPINAVVHSYRLCAFGTWYDPHQIYMSSPTNHEDFTGATVQTLRVRSEIGDRLMCGVSFQGVLWLWKYPAGIFYIDDSDPDPLNWVVRVRSETLGCAHSPHAVLAMDDDILFLAPTGRFHLLSAVDTLGGTSASDLTQALGLNEWIRQNVNISRLDQTASCWYSHRKIAYFAVPSRESSENDLLLVFDFSRGSDVLPRFSYSRAFRATAFALYLDDEGADTVDVPRDGVLRPILAQNGNVWKLDSEDRKVGVGPKPAGSIAPWDYGGGYTGSFTTAPIDMRHVTGEALNRKKQWDFLELVFKPVSTGTVDVVVVVDGRDMEALSFDATKGRERKILHVGSGHTISLRGAMSAGSSHDCKILEAVVGFKITNEDASWEVTA
jgi:hypothetical protein